MFACLLVITGTTHRNFIKFSVSYLCPWLGAFWRRCDMLRTSGFVDDATMTHIMVTNRRRKRVYTQSDLPGQAHIGPT